MKIVKSENSDHKEELVILKKNVTKLNNKLSDMEARSCLNNSMNRETTYGNIAYTSYNRVVKLILFIFFCINSTPVPMKARSGNSTLPKSCDDLKQLGHKLSGIYPIQGEGINSNKITLTFCQFSLSPSFSSVENVYDNNGSKKR